LLKAARKLSPHAVDAFAAICDSGRFQPGSLLDFANAARSAWPDARAPRMVRAEALYRMDDGAQAQLEFETLKTESPKDPVVNRRLAELYRRAALPEKERECRRIAEGAAE
jgi:predicted Zn-dependent protease